jgi:hypothetical protein
VSCKLGKAFGVQDCIKINTLFESDFATPSYTEAVMSLQRFESSFASHEDKVPTS